MKTLGAVIATALITAGGTFAAEQATISPGQGIHVAGTSIGCVGYGATSGNALVCSKLGSQVYANVFPTGVAISKGKPLGDIASADFPAFVASGGVLLYSTWTGQTLNSQTSALESKVASLDTQLSQVQSALATSKSALAAAQSGAVGAVESMGLPTVMKTFFPQLATWVKSSGGSVTAFTDSSTGYASYGFSCDSCAPG